MTGGKEYEHRYVTLIQKKTMREVCLQMHATVMRALLGGRTPGLWPWGRPSRFDQGFGSYRSLRDGCGGFKG